MNLKRAMTKMEKKHLEYNISSVYYYNNCMTMTQLMGDDFNTSEDFEGSLSDKSLKSRTKSLEQISESSREHNSLSSDSANVIKIIKKDTSNANETISNKTSEFRQDTSKSKRTLPSDFNNKKASHDIAG